MRILLAIIAALSFLLLPADHRLMSTGDDDDYFAVATSLAFGKFPSFAHEYHAGEKMPFASVGPGILAAPFVAVFSLGDRLSDAPIVAKREKGNRYWTWSLLGFNFSAYFYLLLGTFFLYRALLYWGSRHAATITSFLSIAAGGGLLIYVFRRPVMSHVFEFFTVTLAVFLLSRRLKEGEWRGMSLVVGTCAAFIFLTRYNNAFLAAGLMATFAFLSYRSSKTIPIVEMVKMAAPFLLLILVFRLLPVLVNGYSQFDQGYAGALGRLLPAPDPVFYLSRGSDILLGWDMGLLFTAPALLLGAAAAWRYRRTLPAEVMFLAAFSLLNIYFTMGWKSFGSYYGYRYISFTAMPFLAVPLIMIVDNLLDFFGEVTTWVMAGLLAWFPLMSMAAFERSGKYGFSFITNQYGEKTFSQPTYHRDLIQDLWLDPFSILCDAADTGVGAFLSADLPPVQVAQRLLLYVGPPALYYLFYLSRKSFKTKKTPSRIES